MQLYGLNSVFIFMGERAADSTQGILGAKFFDEVGQVLEIRLRVLGCCASLVPDGGCWVLWYSTKGVFKLAREKVVFLSKLEIDELPNQFIAIRTSDVEGHVDIAQKFEGLGISVMYF